MSFDRLPTELKQLNQWVCWKYVEVGGGKPTKVPVSARTGGPASTTDPQTWCPFNNAVAYAMFTKGVDGIGFVFTERDEYCGIDLDHLDDEADAKDRERQIKIYEALPSYSETSPSGYGCHIIVKAKVPNGRKRAAVEVYSSGRFFTMTGNVVRDLPITDHQQTVQTLWSQLGKAAHTNFYAGDTLQTIEDKDVYEQAAKALNGDLFTALWNGDGSSQKSASEADLALINIIAFYTKHRPQIARMFMLSGLGKREKYSKVSNNRRNYLLDRMINLAFDNELPPIDISGIIDQVNAAKAARAVPAPTPSPAAAQVAGPVPPQSSHKDGYDLDLWRNLPPPGIIGGITDYIFRTAPRPVYEIALAGALGLLSGICGRSFNVSGTGLNHYIMMLAATGAGKEAMAGGVERLVSAVAVEMPSVMNFIGPGDIASGQALLKHLSDRGTPSFVSITGEIGLRMQQMSSERASQADSQLLRVFLDLFNKSGAGQVLRPIVYSDKKNNTEVIHSPAFSLLGESTPETFYQALDEESVKQGLLPRFLIIEYQGIRVPFNTTHSGQPVPPDLIKTVADLARLSHERISANTFTPIKIDAEAESYLDGINVYCDWQINHSDKEMLKQLWNRVHLKTMKLAGLLAVSVSPYEPTITKLMSEWAMSLVMTDTLRLLERFAQGQMGSQNSGAEQDKLLEKAVIDYLLTEFHDIKKGYGVRPDLHGDKILAYTYLHKKLANMAVFRHDRRGNTNALKAVIQNAIDSGTLREMPAPQLRDKYKIDGGKHYVPGPALIF